MTRRKAEASVTAASVLDELVAEMKSDRARATENIDWERLEASVMARVQDDVPSTSRIADETSGRARGRLWVYAFSAVAAAACVGVVLRHGAPETPASLPRADVPAGVLRATSPGGAAVVDGVAVGEGYALRTGQRVHVEGGPVAFDEPRAAWIVAPADGQSADVKVVSTERPLVLELQAGSIEAEVQKDHGRETFAIDVPSPQGTVRMAVRGTHLRVTRDGERIVLDLSEGVVVVGRAPRSGETTGQRVVAPAHVEIEGGDVESLRAIEPRDAPEHEDAPHAEAKLRAPRSAQGEGHRLAVGTTSREDVHAFVRSCAASVVRPGAVRVTVSSALRIEVTPDGSVKSASFDPPLRPEVQRCIATELYRARFRPEEHGVVTIPVTLTF